MTPLRQLWTGNSPHRAGGSAAQVCVDVVRAGLM